MNLKKIKNDKQIILLSKVQKVFRDIFGHPKKVKPSKKRESAIDFALHSIDNLIDKKIPRIRGAAQ